MKTLEEKTDTPKNAEDAGSFELNEELCSCGGSIRYSHNAKAYKCNKCLKKYSPQEILS